MTINPQAYISSDQPKDSTIQTFTQQFQMFKFQNAQLKINSLFGSQHLILLHKAMLSLQLQSKIYLFLSTKSNSLEFQRTKILALRSLLTSMHQMFKTTAFSTQTLMDLKCKRDN